MRSSQWVYGIVLLAAGLVLAGIFWGGALTGKRQAAFYELTSPIVFLLGATIFITRAFRNVVLLSLNAIELRDLSGARVLAFDNIKGRRRYLSKGGEEAPDVWHLVIESNDDRFPNLDIEELYAFDTAFYAWFNALPDLDAEAKGSNKDSKFGLV